MLMYNVLLASKKKTKDTSKSTSVNAADPDFNSSPLTEGLGQPLQGQPLNEEWVVMEGNSNIPPASAADHADRQTVETDGSDSSKTKRDDL